MHNITTIMENQKIYFESNETKSVSFRKEQLKRLFALIKNTKLIFSKHLKLI